MKGFNWDKIDTSLELFTLLDQYACHHNYNILWSECLVEEDKQLALLAFIKKSNSEFIEENWEEGVNWFPNKYIVLSKNKKLIFRNV